MVFGKVVFEVNHERKQEDRLGFYADGDENRRLCGSYELFGNLLHRRFRTAIHPSYHCNFTVGSRRRPRLASIFDLGCLDDCFETSINEYLLS